MRAAIELADAEGPEAISMRRIAGRLGVGAMTLYGYVADRDALLAHMIDEVVAEMGEPGRPSGSWRADLELLARRFRDLNIRHAWLPAEMGTTPFVISARLVAWADFILAALDLPGIGIETAGAVLRAVNNYVVGMSLREATESRSAGLRDAGYQAAVASYLRQLAANDRYPHMGKLALAVAEGRDLSAEQSFELGLTCLLEGIGALIARAKTHSHPRSAQ